MPCRNDMIQTLKIDSGHPKTVICVQKPYMERRTFATGKIWWPETEILVTSPLLSIDDMHDKGHLNSERIFEVIVFPKMQT